MSVRADPTPHLLELRCCSAGLQLRAARHDLGLGAQQLAQLGVVRLLGCAHVHLALPLLQEPHHLGWELDFALHAGAGRGTGPRWLWGVGQFKPWW